MKNKLVLVLALILGLLAAFLVYTYLNSVKQAADNQVYTPVVVAVQDIPANTGVSNEMVALKPFPKDFITGQEIVDVNAVTGRITVAPITKGQVLMEKLAVKPGDNVSRLAYVIPNGMRAMTVAVNEVNGVANMISKGDRVDIIGVIAGGAVAEPRSLFILQNIEVLALGTSLAPPAAGAVPATITLSVDPQSALKLKMAVQTANISFLLRSSLDKNLVTAVPVTINEF